MSERKHRDQHISNIAIRCVEQSVQGYAREGAGEQVNGGWEHFTLPGSTHHSLAIPMKPMHSKKSFRKPFSGSPMRPVAGDALNRLLNTSIGEMFGGERRQHGGERKPTDNEGHWRGINKTNQGCLRGTRREAFRGFLDVVSCSWRYFPRKHFFV